MLLNQKPDPMDRLAQSNSDRMQAETRQVLREKAKADKLDRYAQFLEPQDARSCSDVRLKLMQAGYRGQGGGAALLLRAVRAGPRAARLRGGLLHG